MYVVSTPDTRNPFLLVGLENVNMTAVAFRINLWAAMFVFAGHIVGPNIWRSFFQRGVGMLSAQAGKSAQPGLLRRALMVLWRTIW
jgi:hypothetical protein